MTRDGVLAIGSAVLVALLLGAALHFSAFRIVFLPPAFLLVLLQTLALLLPSPQRVTVFAVAELVYSIGIAGALAFGLHFLPQIDAARALEAQTRFETARDALPAARQTLEDAEAELREARAQLDAISPEQHSACLAQHLERSLRPPYPLAGPGEGPALIDPLDACAGISQAMLNEATRSGRLDAARAAVARHETAVAVGPDPLPLDPRQRAAIAEVLLLWAPMLLLCGMAIQVGRATSALRG
jgi:hypothetical protein